MKAKSLTQEVQKLRKNRQFLAILILLFVCVMFWTGFTLISSQHKTKIDAALTKLAVPLTPTLDDTVITAVEQKTWYEDDQLTNFPIYKIVTSRSDRLDRVVNIDTPEEEIEALSKPTPRPTTTGTPLQSQLEQEVAPVQ